MSKRVHVAAVDLGASSGRVMVGTVGPGELNLRAAARFPNEPLRLPDGLHWNLPGLYASVLAGLRTAAVTADLRSVGVDTWAVDYALMRGDQILDLPFHYRDEARIERGPVMVHAAVSPAELYHRNGLQYLPFNTLYQLAADHLTDEADRMLLLPDLVGYWLTGLAVAERTNASTTGLLDVSTRDWDRDLAETLGVEHLLPSLVDPGATLGHLLPTAAQTVGADLPVVAVGSHDTASAVVAVPMTSDDAAYISLGTWGLVGLELPEPVLTEEARTANFTNEGGVDGTVRFLTNVMGTWLLSETLRSWGESAESLPELLEAAAEVDSVTVFDVQHPRFIPPGDMPGRVASWCAEHGAPVPESRPALVRSIVESLAAAYAAALTTAAKLSGRSIDAVHVVGGGAQNALLCQAIADRSGLPVLAGPVEATALGNVLVQARAAGVVGPDLTSLRELVARTHPSRRFTARG